jgi:plastocyanin
MKKASLILGVIMLLGLVLSACSGNAGASSSGGTNVTITMADFSYTPATLTVPAGKVVNVTLINKGSVAHTWVLLKTPIQAPADDKAKGDTIVSQSVDAGKTATFNFTAPAAGSYQVVCDLPGHLEAGMEMKVIVQ